jgi:phosphatidylglycerophosphate synthase
MASKTSILYDRVLSPFYDELSRLLWPSWLHPNMITIIAGINAAISVVCMRNAWWSAACATFTFYHACDNMDGKHARRYGKTSSFGHILDHAVDGSVGLVADVGAVALCICGSPPRYILHGMIAGMRYMLTCHAVERASGTACLGTRWFSIDEMNLMLTAALWWRAATGRSVLQLESDVATNDMIISGLGAGVVLFAVTALLPLWRRATLSAAVVAGFVVASEVLPFEAAGLLFAMSLSGLLMANS